MVSPPPASAFRIIPGVTAGLGGLAYANIPATTRDTNHGVILVTGQYAAGNDGPNGARSPRPGCRSSSTWAWAAWREIAAALITAGLSPETPTAVVCEATTPRQRVLVTTLQRVAADAAAQGLGSPSIVAIGEMVKLRAALTPFAMTL